MVKIRLIFGAEVQVILKELNKLRFLSFSAFLTLFTFLALPASNAEPTAPPPPIISAVPQDGSLLIYVQPGAGAPVDRDTWFYQLRADEECSNPYGNTSTWDTGDVGGFVSSFQIGRQPERYGVDLSVPLTNGCTYTVNVYQIVSDYPEGEIASLTVVPRALRPVSAEELAEIQRTIQEAALVEVVEQREVRRANAVKNITYSNSHDGSKVSLHTFVNAGVESAIPETLDSLNSFLLSLDATQRSNIQLLEKKAFELRQNYFVSQLQKDFSLTNLLNLKFTGVSERMLPTLRANLLTHDSLGKGDVIEIQRQIDIVNILFKGRDSGTLSASDLSRIGVKISLQDKTSEILYRFHDEPDVVFDSIQTIQQSISDIETLIQERIERASSAKARTNELRAKIESRKR